MLQLSITAWWGGGGGLLYKLSQLINSYWDAPQRNTYQVENEINTGHEPRLLY